ncbi:AraC family transcriptional regulator [Nitrospira sp. KM1]|uniref:AraC family transcriptional regulator n=1 Tax=Nitrospira sp. KM1 TaxID=1936990 RepID=UPI0015676301|nr:AraC family transcriptional regulator [Nitrospira sp. KM1]
MDVLSEVLKAVKLDGAMFYNAEFSAPWCFRSPASRIVAPYFASGSAHIIIYHLLTEGSGYAHIEGDERKVRLDAGDLVIFPHGDPHVMGNGPSVQAVDSEQELQRILSQGLNVSRMGGGGALTKFICGYMACEPELSSIFLGGLPPVFKIPIRNDPSGLWLEQSLRYSVDHAGASAPGGAAMLAKLSELLFIETLRRYISSLPPEQSGWLAGVRDPEVGKALALLHRHPARPWTIASLGTEVGMSRSVLAERFRRYLSETPMAYLTRWRLQLGAQMLGSTSRSVMQIAAEVGYESEASFNRAFKREFGLPPAKFRTKARTTMKIGAHAAKGAFVQPGHDDLSNQRPVQSLPA